MQAEALPLQQAAVLVPATKPDACLFLTSVLWDTPL